MNTSQWLAAVILSMTVLLTGCATDSHAITDESQATLDQKLIRGQTTKNQVISQWGAPGLKGRSGTGQEYWSYFDEKNRGKTSAPPAPFGGYGDGVKILTVFFTGKDVVDHFQFSVERD